MRREDLNSNMIVPVTLNADGNVNPASVAVNVRVDSVAIPGAAIPTSPNARAPSMLFTTGPLSSNGAGNLVFAAPASPPAAPMTRLELKVDVPASTHDSGASSPNSAGSAGNAHPISHSAPARLESLAATVPAPTSTPTPVRMLRLLEQEFGQGGPANDQDDCTCRSFCSFFCCSCCYQRCYGEDAKSPSANVADSGNMQREDENKTPTPTISVGDLKARATVVTDSLEPYGLRVNK